MIDLMSTFYTFPKIKTTITCAATAIATPISAYRIADLAELTVLLSPPEFINLKELIKIIATETIPTTHAIICVATVNIPLGPYIGFEVAAVLLSWQDDDALARVFWQGELQVLVPSAFVTQVPFRTSTGAVANTSLD
jgi:hypothetical protein